MNCEKFAQKGEHHAQPVRPNREFGCGPRGVLFLRGKSRDVLQHRLSLIQEEDLLDSGRLLPEAGGHRCKVPSQGGPNCRHRDSRQARLGDRRGGIQEHLPAHRQHPGVHQDRRQGFQGGRIQRRSPLLRKEGDANAGEDREAHHQGSGDRHRHRNTYQRNLRRWKT